MNHVKGTFHALVSHFNNFDKKAFTFYLIKGFKIETLYDKSNTIYNVQIH